MYEEPAQKLRIAILAGGESAEREVSLASGGAVAPALAAAGHQLEIFDPAIDDLDQIAWSEFDVCFIALHGGPGEDGRVQRRLETRGVCYTGSDPAASQLAMSKSAAKERFIEQGVPTADFLLVDAPAENSRPFALTELGWPLVVKPDRQGSSIGVGFAATEAELCLRMDEARQFDSRVLLERWIDGREFTAAVLGRRPLPLIEIITPRALFDYEAKYESALTQYRFEHGLSETLSQQITLTAVAAAEALGTSGLVRVDVMVDRAGRPFVLEVNTVPGLTNHSLAPKAAARAGLNMTNLCQWMIHDALLAEVNS